MNRSNIQPRFLGGGVNIIGKGLHHVVLHPHSRSCACVFVSSFSPGSKIPSFGRQHFVDTTGSRVGSLLSTQISRLQCLQELELCIFSRLEIGAHCWAPAMRTLSGCRGHLGAPWWGMIVIPSKNP